MLVTKRKLFKTQCIKQPNADLMPLIYIHPNPHYDVQTT